MLVLELCQKSDEELYDVIKTAAADSAISEATQKMLSFSLSLRIYSPKIEASRSTSLPYPQGCEKDAFLSYGENSACSEEKISSFDFSSLSESEPTDLSVQGSKIKKKDILARNSNFKNCAI